LIKQRQPDHKPRLVQSAHSRQLVKLTNLTTQGNADMTSKQPEEKPAKKRSSPKVRREEERPNSKTKLNPKPKIKKRKHRRSKISDSMRVISDGKNRTKERKPVRQ